MFVLDAEDHIERSPKMNRLINNKLISIFRHNDIPHVVIVDMKKDVVNCLSGEEVEELAEGLSQEDFFQEIADIPTDYSICDDCIYSDQDNGTPCDSCYITCPTKFIPKRD